jgi:leader peptidase (prepilin peptidase) / N-methyltransferase
MNPYLTTAAAAYGLLAGAQLPQAAYRLSVPPEQPWRTTCPAGHPLPALLPGSGRCRDCQAPYGPRLTVVSVITGVVCVALALAVGPRPELAVWLLLAPVGVLMAVVDQAVHRLPDVLTLPTAAGCLVALGLATLLPGSAGSWITALLGALTTVVLYFILFVINPSGLGFGDVKLSATIGLALGWYGWTAVFEGVAAGLLLAAGYAGVLLMLRRASRDTALPLGPFMLAGALLGICTGGLAA